MGTFRGRLIVIGHYPGAVPSVDNSDRIVGETYRLEPAAKALSLLDD